MRALIVKELAEQRLLLLFPAVLVVLVLAAGSAGQALALLSLDDANLILYSCCALVPPVLGALAGSPLFAGEFSRGTIPLLFTLPLSRLRIWAAKAVAAAALAVLGTLIFTAPALTATGVVPAADLSFVAPTLLVLTLAPMAVSLFCSVLSERPLNALLATLMLTPVLAIVPALAGGRLESLGRPTHDPSTLCFFLLVAAPLPPLLLASAVTVQRGETLTRARKWLVALLSLGGGLLLMTPVALLAWLAFPR